jgi:hypothetical protein
MTSRLVETLFPFRDFPHDLAQFLAFARREGSVLNAYKEHAQAVDRALPIRVIFSSNGMLIFPAAICRTGTYCRRTTPAAPQGV